MIWIYERGDTTLTIETRFNRETKMYELMWHEADGSVRVENFQDEQEFRGRITAISTALRQQQWRQSGPPMIDPDGWRM